MQVFYTLLVSGFDPRSFMEGIKRRCKRAINDAYHLCAISCTDPCLLMDGLMQIVQSDPSVMDELFILCALLFNNGEKKGNVGVKHR